MSARLPHVPALDAVRGSAILAVILYHVAVFVGPGPGLAVRSAPAFAAFYFSWSSVQLFFVLSGFLITRILLGAKDSPGYFRRFYARRARRILPLYLIFLVVVGILGAPHLWVPALYLTNLAVWWQGHWLSPLYDHSWSLCVEEHFYFVWPAVVLALSRRGLTYVCLGAVASAMIYRAVGVNVGASLAGIRVNTLANVDGLAWGGLVALLLTAATPRLRLFYAVTSAATAAVILLLAFLTVEALRGIQHPALTEGLYPSLACGAFALLVKQAAGSRRSFAPLARVGKYSYCMYLVQQPVIFYGAPFFRGVAASLPASAELRIVSVWAATSVIFFALGAVSFHLIEAPILRR